jgi:hypothetical protein
MLARCPTFDQPNVHLGPEAAVDDQWVARLRSELCKVGLSAKRAECNTSARR